MRSFTPRGVSLGFQEECSPIINLLILIQPESSIRGGRFMGSRGWYLFLAKRNTTIRINICWERRCAPMVLPVLEKTVGSGISPLFLLVGVCQRKRLWTISTNWMI